MECGEELRSTRATRFHLSDGSGTMSASGVARSWDAPLAGSLPAEVAATLGADGEGAGVAVGALPFRPDRPAHLFEPLELTRGPAPGDIGAAASRPLPPACRGPLLLDVDAGPGTGDYETRVARALQILADESTRSDGLQKVVLARSVLLHTPEPVDATALVERLRADPVVAVFSVPLPPAQDAGSGVFVGATPELLLDKAGPRILSGPLAGSVPRGRDAASDAAAAEALQRSAKDLFEHRLVVEYIADVLTPYCRELSVPERPSLVSTQSMWHLGTRIAGVLRDPSVSSLALLAALHPTPAVCGFPADRAASAISELEGLDRGFYGGAVGWCDGAGDGRWHLAIRCAEVTPDAVRLFAGAGIVAGSEPAREAAETSAKMRAMLTALGMVGEEADDLDPRGAS